jgi:excisionase family DNA binding protein
MTNTLTLSLREAAELTGYSLNIIEAAVQRGDLKARQAPGIERKNRRILRKDLEAWLDQLPEAS